MTSPDFVVVGHVSRDTHPYAAALLGGPAAYAALTGRRLGRVTGLLTDHDAEPSGSALLPDIQIATAGPSARLDVEHVPWPWLDTQILLAAPARDEIDLTMLDRFGRSLVGVLADGFLAAQPNAGLPTTGVVVLEEGAVPAEPDALRARLGGTPIAVSAGPEHGVRLSWRGQWETIGSAADGPATWSQPARAVLAAAFLVRLAETRDPQAAAEFAAVAVALLPSPVPPTPDAIPTRQAITARLNG